MLAMNSTASIVHANALQLANICPSFFMILSSIYRESTELFLGLNTLRSYEGTTQSDPLSIPFYVLATTPLINALCEDTPEVK